MVTYAQFIVLESVEKTKYYAKDIQTQWDVQHLIFAFQKVRKLREKTLEQNVLGFVQNYASNMKSCVSAKKIVMGVIQKKLVAQKQRIIMDYFVPMIQLPMIVQFFVMKLKEKFYAQLTKHHLDASQGLCAWLVPYTPKQNIVQVTQSVLKIANGMRYNAPMGLIHEDARTKICV
jgi:hypothetical protein